MQNPNETHSEQLSASNRVGLWITLRVGTMACAAVFGILALVALPSAWAGGMLTMVQWVSQTFIQLVMLSIITVGQNLQADHATIKADADHLMLTDVHTKLDQLLAEITQRPLP